MSMERRMRMAMPWADDESTDDTGLHWTDFWISDDLGPGRKCLPGKQQLEPGVGLELQSNFYNFIGQ